ncbi:proline-rich membrane anchor 1 isoform X4 [Melanerpes formicivorus]|uniref:proline-rich membrane anchor 1 isoform X4 n=1 Tax=Melanerpes formicivorus TaxID=211600 RepID=UPI00358E8683
MLLRELLGLLRCCWPSLLLHCALHPLWGSVQITRGEPQKSCSKPVAEKVTESCQQICQCRPPPPLPPPPPPPPPPRLLAVPSYCYIDVADHGSSLEIWDVIPNSQVYLLSH